MVTELVCILQAAEVDRATSDYRLLNQKAIRRKNRFQTSAGEIEPVEVITGSEIECVTVESNVGDIVALLNDRLGRPAAKAARHRQE